MKPNRPYFPCQTDDGRTFVMRGTRIVDEIGGQDTVERWRTAQYIAGNMNDEAAVARTGNIAIAVLVVLIVLIGFGIGLAVRIAS